MIDIVSVTKNYASKPKANNAISLQIHDGEIFGFIGSNGAGKSTLLKLMCGLLELDEGSISLNGHSISEAPYEAKKQFVFVSDTPDHFLGLKAIDYLNFICDMHEISEDVRKARILELAQEFNLQDQLQERINAYSHGMRQKLMVLAALAVNPPIWILDEPLVGLDPRSAFKLKERMLAHARAGNIVIFSTHVLEVAQNLVDRLGIIAQGELIFAGTFPELQERYAQEGSSLETIFLELTEEPSEDTSDALDGAIR